MNSISGRRESGRDNFLRARGPLFLLLLLFLFLRLPPVLFARRKFTLYAAARWRETPIYYAGICTPQRGCVVADNN